MSNRREGSFSGTDRAGISILLVRAKRDPSAWIFPKGHIEPGETARATAVRETREEAGVQGEATGEIGDPQEFEWAGRWYRVQYFLIRMTSESDETDGREKAWFPFDEALESGQLRERTRPAASGTQENRGPRIMTADQPPASAGRRRRRR